MKAIKLKSIVPVLLVSFCLFNCENDTMKEDTYTYVLVHGATGGGWDWKTIQELLESQSHEAFRPTLTGLGERVHLSSPDVDLSTHVSDIVNLILFEKLDNIVLVGHSYGGMVITGVMDSIPERIRHVVFLDAAVPNHGMSALEIFGGSEASLPVTDGHIHFAWIDADQPYPRDVPQSMKTFTEPVSFQNPEALKLPATYVAFVESDHLEERKATDGSWKRAAERGWEIITLNSDHNAQRSHPESLVEILESAPKSE